MLGALQIGKYFEINSRSSVVADTDVESSQPSCLVFDEIRDWMKFSQMEGMEVINLD